MIESSYDFCLFSDRTSTISCKKELLKILINVLSHLSRSHLTLIKLKCLHDLQKVIKESGLFLIIFKQLVVCYCILNFVLYFLSLMSNLNILQASYLCNTIKGENRLFSTNFIFSHCLKLTVLNFTQFLIIVIKFILISFSKLVQFLLRVTSFFWFN